LNKISYWCFTVIVLLLTWIGARSVEDPYILTGQVLSCLYFTYYLINPFIIKFWDIFIKIWLVSLKRMAWNHKKRSTSLA
jgi:quinol-cytochrome oxidoreductase complex cytochrome b subunit